MKRNEFNSNKCSILESMKRKSRENIDQNQKIPRPNPNRHGQFSYSGLHLQTRSFYIDLSKNNHYESIRERFRYYKQKKSKPKWPEDIVGGVQTSFEFPKNNITNKFCTKIDFPNGAALYRNALENSFLEKLGQKCLFEFPLMNDSITNIEKLTGDNIKQSDLGKFNESTLIGRLDSIRQQTGTAKLD